MKHWGFEGNAEFGTILTFMPVCCLFSPVDKLHADGILSTAIEACADWPDTFGSMTGMCLWRHGNLNSKWLFSVFCQKNLLMLWSSSLALCHSAVVPGQLFCKVVVWIIFWEAMLLFFLGNAVIARRKCTKSKADSNVSFHCCISLILELESSLCFYVCGKWTTYH